MQCWDLIKIGIGVLLNIVLPTFDETSILFISVKSFGFLKLF